ncbi:fumarylacetoacetate hydrolase family protein [Evansella cellulosilytica]|uniref:5-carboxymethyl-2-hydroxymuconate Delta-isomerase n=1 Tax=Evansella cellulosilytica (strain ATCC 21833 / DSM 2522 / FERM P-1141 / JCM 9156 / N-4) TaxID=649639 RepID=E6TY16_EVAC2|nr:fumarylacetoacetate hydrolase family protein [Evansella cellulosilytica]ADU31229.1 5-carboxymethyl-2-hydroxymuconate Delta-isomerase [Evansella cellulosilytica DSM 2522]
MKFVSFTYNGEPNFGLVVDEGQKVVPLGNGIIASTSFLDFLSEEDGMKKVRKIEAEWNDVEALSVKDPLFKWEAPIPKPNRNIFAVGKNYIDHAKEMGSESAPSSPVIFTKAPTTVIGNYGDIQLHRGVTEKVDYEGELAVILGRGGKGISESEAWDYIFGFTIMNDVTARDLQKQHQQFFIGKSLDTFCPMGPYIIDKESFYPFHDKELITKVNGEVRQRATFDLMVFSIPTIIETLSKGMTLQKGDIIAMGTPKGTGSGYQPPKFLKDGDTVEIKVEGLGTLVNQVRN